MKNTSLIYCVIGSLMLLAFGCGDLKNEKAPTQPSISVHGEGFADTTHQSSSNFHTKYIQSKHYDIQLCKQCHGGDYSGGTAKMSCLTCHNKPAGPENCTTCHGSVNAAPPKDLSGNTSPSVRTVGAHQKHLLGGIAGAVACKECHVVPSSVLSVGHIDATPGAEVRFDSLSIFHKSDATYNDGTCANTYCHGNFTGGNKTAMSWTNTNNAAQCGTCHGDVNGVTPEAKAFPKSGHISIAVGKKCSDCHSDVVDQNLTIINPAKHILGRITW